MTPIRVDAGVPKRKKKFDYEALKAAATSEDRAVRKVVFIEYFEEFREFPSYLFDNEKEIHKDLWDTAQDILTDKKVAREVRNGVDQLLNRLPHPQFRQS